MARFYASYQLTNGQTVHGGNFPAESSEEALQMVTNAWMDDELFIKLQPDNYTRLALVKAAIVAVKVNTESKTV